MIEKSMVELAELIFADYPLCDWCLGRQFPSYRGKHDKLKGEMIRREVGVVRKEGCFICQGIMQSLNDFSVKTVEKLRDYEFDDFLMGATLPREVIEREDELRAKFKLRGGESIKREITSEIGKAVASKTGKKVNFRKPDVTILMNFISGEVNITSKPVFVYGRYLKKVRGLSQKRRKCRECRGRGCKICGYTGFMKEESVEQILAQRLIEHFKGKRAKFTWIGGESIESVVLGSGRPFYAEISEPKLRHLDESRILKDQKGVILKEIRVADKKPKDKPSFIVTVSAHVRFEEDVDEGKLYALKKALQNTEVEVRSLKKKVFTKKVYDFHVERMDDREAKIHFRCDGGLNIRRFIGVSNSGKRDTMEITPNVSEILGIDLVCDVFDILDLEILNDKNGFR
ncbi:MAG: tRNA pseudouridine(54/55) synthase Pus10 [Candidatus Methylarchaceae archaeon HK01B]|nr:tRNA pseudouridine(54/55) synthase Pus10 [Candidatus Methylarchaceae archaeon HK01B]